MIKALLYSALSISLTGESYHLQNKKTFRYLPLGDSYTIGTGAGQKQDWPSLLTEHLNLSQVGCTLLDNPARNAFSTQNLIDHELPLVKKLKPDFVTLLIGVNDWVRDVPKPTFARNLAYILDEIQNTLPDKQKIILLTIPDFGVTPTGKNYGRGKNISEGIAAFNSVIKEEASKRGLMLVDLFETSKKMGSDASLVARDGLHPSAKEYAIWEKLIFPQALKLLQY